MKITERHYQTKAVDNAMRYLASGGVSGIISSATGTGKSIILNNLIKRVIKVKSDTRIIVATHSSKLVSQNAQKLHKMSPNSNIGIYCAGLGKKEIHRQITFASIQSIYKSEINKIHLLIVDEVHSIGRENQSMWLKFISNLKEKNPKLKIIGLSATPFRQDSGNLISGKNALFDKIIFDYGLAQGIQDGYLVEPLPKHTKTEYNLKGVRKNNNEYNIKDLELVVNKKNLNISAVDELIDFGKDCKAWLVFCTGIKHAKAIQDELINKDIPCEMVDSNTTTEERDSIYSKLENGEIKAITNYGVMTTGIDIPCIDLVAMLRFTLNPGLVLQIVGRGTRPIIDLSPYNNAKERREAIANSSKPNCLFLDFGGNIVEHGFLDRIKGKDAKERKKRDGIPPMKFCPKCATICHLSSTKCNDCGYIYPKNTQQIELKRYAGNIMSNKDDPEWRDVIDVKYDLHNAKRKDKIACLRVSYTHFDTPPTKEYILLMHGNDTNAGIRAMEWWEGMGGKNIDHVMLKDFEENFYPQPSVYLDKDIDGENTCFCNVFCTDLKKPLRILVDISEDYERIITYDFDYIYNNLDNDGLDNTLALADDIPF